MFKALKKFLRLLGPRIIIFWQASEEYDRQTGPFEIGCQLKTLAPDFEWSRLSLKLLLHRVVKRAYAGFLAE